MSHYELITASQALPIKAWIRGVPMEDESRSQLIKTARLPFIHHHLAVMPDVHSGLGATIGSVIPTIGAIIPAAVGVDIGCGMCAIRTSSTADDLPDDLAEVRHTIERAVPHGRSDKGGRFDQGAWQTLPARVQELWQRHLAQGYGQLCAKYRQLERGNSVNHLGTLGTGNHFIEVCLDETGQVWIMLHSGSRGVGNRLGEFFIDLAHDDCRKAKVDLPDRYLAFLEEGGEHFADYLSAVQWAQEFARLNRELMLENLLAALPRLPGLERLAPTGEAVNCHHNYVQAEQHFGQRCWVTRKGAMRAGLDEPGIIPGSMGARSYLVRGLGNPDSFCSCSHGAGRAMSRTQAKRRFSVADHVQATAGIECRKDVGVLDETPKAYKDLDTVMAAQADLVEIVHTLRQVVCVKG